MGLTVLIHETSTMMSSQTVAAATRDTSLTQDTVNVTDVDRIGLSVQITGANASSAGEIIFEFITQDYDDNWMSGIWASHVTYVNGTTAITSMDAIDTSTAKAIKLLAIANTDPSYAVTVNHVKVIKKE